MPIRSDHMPPWVPSALAMSLLIASALAISACGNNNDPSTPTDDRDLGVTTPADMSPDASMMVGSCEAPTDCVGEREGQLCVDGQCAPCAQNVDCAIEPAYATARPICLDGACSACVDGRLGCACQEDDTCMLGECVGDQCVDCERGAEGCVCRANGTCEAGFVCGEEGLCEACTPGEAMCPCDAGDQCGDGLVCDSGTCVVDTCSPGQTECPCDAGECDASTSYCDEGGICQVCSSDVAGCPCDLDDSCLGQNYCDTDEDTCLECPDTERPETCGCASDSECAAGLVCDQQDATCRAAIGCDLITCGPFQLCDASMGDAVCAEDCEAGYRWDMATQACVVIPDAESCTDMMGQPSAEALACQAQNKACVVDADVVVCVDTCAQLDCALSSRTCTQGATATNDAFCDACLPGFMEEPDPMDATATICVSDPSASCDAMAANSIAAQCAAQFRECLPGANGQGASCGDCVPGRVLNTSTNQCVEASTCGGQVCATDEFCLFPQDGSTPTCQARCPAGEAFDEASGACTPCAVTCNGDELYGATVDGQCACAQDVFCAFGTNGSSSRCQVSVCGAGEASIDGSAATCSTCNISCGTNGIAGQGTRVWPLRDRSGACMCETLEGFYMAYGLNAQPRRCDADQDGWINETAEQTWQDATATPLDDAMLANFRCERREIDRVILENEYGQRRAIGVCSAEVLDWTPGQLPAACGGAPEVVGLFEPDTLDSDNLVIQNPNELPLYGQRAVAASALNATTKGCKTLGADYNLNGREDILEAGPLETAGLTWVANPSPSDLLFAAASHFMELHTSRYEAGSGTVGRYVVSERSRCDDFPLTYQVGPDLYWEGCTRKRVADFDRMGSLVGKDFAAFSCATTTGTCELPPPELFVTGMNVDGDGVVDHDLCALEAAGLLPLPNEPWLGMSHHSQFQCAQVSSAGSAHHLSRATLRGGGSAADFDANTCEVSGATPQAIDGPQPSVPTITCAYTPGDSVSLPDDSVTFVSANFSHESTYSRGCINEALDTVAGVVAPSVDIGRGFSRLCGGFSSSGICLGSTCTTAVASSGNGGDFGKLICGCDVNYSGASCERACAPGELHVGGWTNNALTVAERALYACTEASPDASYYCRELPPDGAFPGGVRGAWLCGEFTQTATTQGTDPRITGTVGAQSATLHGNIRDTPVIRAPMTHTTASGGTFTLY